jgi:CBS domain containing-hemolysin-like protein
MMIPIKDVFMFDYNEYIDKPKLKVILDKGYSRIPVYSVNRN